MTDVPLVIAGLPVEGGSDIRQPLAAIAVIKGLDDSGSVSYWYCGTGGVSRVEALGMAVSLLDSIRDSGREQD